jgi:predicted pyridoxine 5'-phosphate oxidase superfamily flavin-nucleotide-binding protein
MKIPEAVKEAWKRREGPVVLATVDVAGRPNVIYVTCVSLYGDDRLLVADNYFDKTRKNIKAGSQGAVLFMTSDKKPYQLKGTVEYHSAGPVFDDMKKWNPPKHPGHAAAALVVEEAYSGAQRLTP